MNLKIEMLESELLPILPFCEVIFKDNYFDRIGLKASIKLSDLREFGIIPQNTTSRQFSKLLDWFESNTEEIQFILSNNMHLGFNRYYMEG